MAFSGLRNHRKVVSGRLDGGFEQEKESEEFGGKGMKANGGARRVGDDRWGKGRERWI